ncbi:hypothetical protein GN958_ATG03117 [Phytophthora infestans]|uniref:Uncharacterized protein n=1 Tax=Phytophthora infestans TaxID=4787 RepID=A0A8S9V8P7_PHYIN|nr:hypothetical protein GN958_ATG03117 [Phytophthora infestans]
MYAGVGKGNSDYSGVSEIERGGGCTNAIGGLGSRNAKNRNGLAVVEGCETANAAPSGQICSELGNGTGPPTRLTR